MLFRPYRDSTCPCVFRPTVETVGYCRASLTGRRPHLASASGLETTIRRTPARRELRPRGWVLTGRSYLDSLFLLDEGDDFAQVADDRVFVPQGHPTIAHRFMGGIGGNETPKAPEGRKTFRVDYPGHHRCCVSWVYRLCGVSLVHHRCRVPLGNSFVPTGTRFVIIVYVPPLKRWAIIGRP